MTTKKFPNVEFFYKKYGSGFTLIAHNKSEQTLGKIVVSATHYQLGAFGPTDIVSRNTTDATTCVKPGEKRSISSSTWLAPVVTQILIDGVPVPKESFPKDAWEEGVKKGMIYAFNALTFCIVPILGFLIKKLSVPIYSLYSLYKNLGEKTQRIIRSTVKTVGAIALSGIVVLAGLKGTMSYVNYRGRTLDREHRSSTNERTYVDTKVGAIGSDRHCFGFPAVAKEVSFDRKQRVVVLGVGNQNKIRVRTNNNYYDHNYSNIPFQTCVFDVSTADIEAPEFMKEEFAKFLKDSGLLTPADDAQGNIKPKGGEAEKQPAPAGQGTPTGQSAGQATRPTTGIQQTGEKLSALEPNAAEPHKPSFRAPFYPAPLALMPLPPTP